MSYCTKHPSKEAVGACSNCGHLVCKACYNEINNKVYCTDCTNKLFTIKEAAPKPAFTPTPAQPQPTAAQPAKPVEPPSQPAPTAPQMKETPVTPTVPPTPPKPAVPDATPKPLAASIPEAKQEPVIAARPEIKPPAPAEIKPALAEIKPPVEVKAVPAELKPAPAEVKPAVEVKPAPAEVKPVLKVEKPKPEKARAPQPSSAGAPGWLWWLAPIFLAFIGGLLAWLVNKNSEPNKARLWLFTGIGLTVVYAAVIAGIMFIPAISPSEGSIVFARYFDKSWQIWVMDQDGKNAGKITACDNTSPYFNVYPSYAPASGILTTYTNRDGNFEIYSMDAMGKNQVNLTMHNYLDLFADISPDGKKIAFTTNRDGNSEIYSMNADGSDLKRLTISNGIDDRPRWSPDGKQIVFNTDRDGNHEIYVMDGEGNNQRRLTNSDKWDAMGRWSPDGKKIAFVSERDGNPEIYIMDADGANQKRITFNSAKDYAPCFSPDGKRIAFYSNTDGGDKIYIMNTDGGNQVRLTDNKDGDQYPLWVNAKLKAPADPEVPPFRTKYIGSSISTANKWFNFSDNVTFVKFVAEKDGSVDMIKVFSGAAGKVKVAIYEHNNRDDIPMSKLSSNDQPVDCAANQWNNIYIQPVTLIKGMTYWLAFNSDVNGVVRQGTGKSRTLVGKAVFEDFTFPGEPAKDMKASTWDFSISAWGTGEPVSTDEPETPDEDK